ncbi:MAG: FprA family A-type flavoprotein [Bacteroidales bacterium]|nr:FprA family A-type flavoprotein [Bacteroidales bacterium]
MKKDNQVLAVTDDVKWIGVLDRDIVTFDVVMETKYGTTYNSYFINAERKAVVETTKEAFWDTYLAKIQQVCDPGEIEYIILNHTEPDHSGNLFNLMRLAPKARVVGSGNAIRYLKDLFQPDFPHLIVKDGDTLDLGNKTLHFIGAPNLHWPDTMYTWLPEDRVLFTCDSFGAHFCHDEMFDDLTGNWDDAFKYYFDVILKPFSRFMVKAIDRIRDLDIGVVCTGHGPILRTHWKKYVDLSEHYAREAMQYPEQQRVFIPYVSAYQKTGQLAQAIAEGIRKAGPIEVDVEDIEKSTLGELEEKVTKASAVIVGSPTINQNILLPVYRLFAVITPLRDRGKLAGGFGSYGWSGENRQLIESGLKNLKLDYFGEGVFVKFSPTSGELAQCEEYGKAFGGELLKRG